MQERQAIFVRYVIAKELSVFLHVQSFAFLLPMSTFIDLFAAIAGEVPAKFPTQFPQLPPKQWKQLRHGLYFVLWKRWQISSSTRVFTHPHLSFTCTAYFGTFCNSFRM